MCFAESRLEMEQRHLREAETHVVNQRALVARLEDRGLPVVVAEDLLDRFEQSLDEHRTSLARLIEDQRLGLRDARGDRIWTR